MKIEDFHRLVPASSLLFAPCPCFQHFKKVSVPSTFHMLYISLLFTCPNAVCPHFSFRQTPLHFQVLTHIYLIWESLLIKGRQIECLCCLLVCSLFKSLWKSLHANSNFFHCIDFFRLIAFIIQNFKSMEKCKKKMSVNFFPLYFFSLLCEMLWFLREGIISHLSLCLLSALHSYWHIGSIQ